MRRRRVPNPKKKRCQADGAFRNAAKVRTASAEPGQKTGRLKFTPSSTAACRSTKLFRRLLERGSGGAAFDVAPLATAKDELERQMAAHSRTLDKVSTGVAVFGADRKLVYSNDAFARIWALDEPWLQEKPLSLGTFRPASPAQAASRAGELPQMARRQGLDLGPEPHARRVMAPSRRQDRACRHRLPRRWRRHFPVRRCDGKAFA